MLTMGPDSDTYADNEISLKIVGERGTSIVTNPDSRVKDYKIDWQFDGFRTLGGKRQVKAELSREHRCIVTVTEV